MAMFKDLSPLQLRSLQVLIAILTPLQLGLLYLADAFFAVYLRLVGREKRRRKVVVGVTETARIIYFLGHVFPSSYTCVLDRNPFYRDRYDYGPYVLWLRPLVGPLLLAYLSRLADTFLYISFTGFLARREHDFRFLKRRGKKIVTLFCGSDIRSLKKTKEFFDARGEDSIANYLPATESELYDRMVHRTAADADAYADLVFNWSFDQIGYLTRPSRPWPYMLDLDEYPYEFRLPRGGEKLVLLHAPGYSAIKGTPLVRAAVKKLRLEGYDFEYRELQNVPHPVVIESLGRSHIVLQEFYLLTPGVLGIEAMARGNAVLMSACREANPELPADAEGAWVVTRYWEVYDRLRELLDRPERIESYARKGREFVERNYGFDSVREYYTREFESRQIPC